MSVEPETPLLHSLQSLFHIEAMRNGKYTYAEIQNLKTATEEYQRDNTASFIKLLQALKASLPYLEKRKVDFNAIRMEMDELAKSQNLTINWGVFLRHPNVSPKFQFSAQNPSRELELIPWVAYKTGKHFADINYKELTQFLLEHRDTFGFSQRITDHLEHDPDFLFRLIIDSEDNFIDIAKTRLSLFLRDPQIAEAIVHHSPKLIKPHINPLIEVEQFVNTLNHILSNGRSVSLLLRNSEAKTILDQSKHFQIFQSEEYKNRHAPHPRKRSREEENPAHDDPKKPRQH